MTKHTNDGQSKRTGKEPMIGGQQPMNTKTSHTQNAAEKQYIEMAQNIAERAKNFGLEAYEHYRYDFQRQMRSAYVQIFASNRREVTIDEIDGILGDMIGREAIEYDVISDRNGVFVNLPDFEQFVRAL